MLTCQPQVNSSVELWSECGWRKSLVNCDERMRFHHSRLTKRVLPQINNLRRSLGRRFWHYSTGISDLDRNGLVVVRRKNSPRDENANDRNVAKSSLQQKLGSSEMRSCSQDVIKETDNVGRWFGQALVNLVVLQNLSHAWPIIATQMGRSSALSLHDKFAHVHPQAMGHSSNHLRHAFVIQRIFPTSRRWYRNQRCCPEPVLFQRSSQLTTSDFDCLLLVGVVPLAAPLN